MSENKNEVKTKVPEWVAYPGGTPEFYGNFIHANWSLYDVRIRIGQLKPILNAMDWVVEERAAVTVSWPQAKVLRDVLSDLIGKYEKANGEIKPINMPGV